MFTLVAGAGYTGRRVLARLPESEAAESDDACQMCATGVCNSVAVETAETVDAVAPLVDLVAPSFEAGQTRGIEDAPATESPPIPSAFRREVTASQQDTYAILQVIRC